MRVDLATGTVSRVPTPPEIATYGIDGLYGHGDALIAVQNGLRPHRVVHFELDANGRVARSTVLAASDQRFSAPTLGAVVAIASASWPIGNGTGSARRLCRHPMPS